METVHVRPSTHPSRDHPPDRQGAASMPRPSDNPLPELPTRLYSLSCPEEQWGPTSMSSWRPGDNVNVDGDEMSSPEPGSATSASSFSEVQVLFTSRQADHSRPMPISSDGGTSPPYSAASEAHELPNKSDSDESGAESVGVSSTTGSHLHTETDRTGDDSNMASPVSDRSSKIDESLGRFVHEEHVPAMGFDRTNVRIIPMLPSSYMRPGSKFRGTQHSERQTYRVEVEIKHVDLGESFLCGYLNIQGLTEVNPTITTYFEGEIIGSKYNFITSHPSWGATEKIDLNHWNKFPEFRPYQKALRKRINHPMSSSLPPSPGLVKDMAEVANKENIFMRWKEQFLLPDHNVQSIAGASFEGFYYICFNQLEGKVSGIYFHWKSEKFQNLSLQHVEDRGCFAAMEFR